ncbi:MAG: hypothetical protein ACKOOE_08210 [Micrococcales bacterium]
MFEKKLTLAAAVVVITLLGAPLAASAAPVHHVASKGGVSIHTEDGEDDDEDDGDDDEDDDHHGSIPPVFVVPGVKKPHGGHKAKPGTSTSTSTGTTAGIDPLSGDPIPQVGPDGQPITSDPGTDVATGGAPQEGRAVDITRVPRHIKTPADEFMDAAYLGLGLLALSAVGLGVTAGVRAIRVRRAGKSDYIYNDK